MKTIPSDLLNCGTLVFGVRIVRKDLTVLAYTEHDVDQTVTVDTVSTLLLGNPGFNIQSLVSSAGFGVDNTDVLINESDDITRVDLLMRKWDGAKVFFFRYNWKLPGSGLIPVKRGSWGNFAPLLGQFKAEFRDQRQAWQQNTTWVFQEGCRWRLGDVRCTVDLVPFTSTPVSVTAASASAYTFTASALVQPSDFFGEGLLLWLTGNNAGCESKVRGNVGDVITLSDAMIGLIQIGDTFTIVAGCRKRFDEDCVAKFSNGINYGGEKDKPTRDDLISTATPV